MDPSAKGSLQFHVPCQAQLASAGQYHISGKQGTARIKQTVCPAIAESYHFINTSRRLSYTPDPQAKELTLALLQWHNLTLQLCLQDSHQLLKLQQCQHTSNSKERCIFSRSKKSCTSWLAITPLKGPKTALT